MPDFFARSESETSESETEEESQESLQEEAEEGPTEVLSAKEKALQKLSLFIDEARTSIQENDYDGLVEFLKAINKTVDKFVNLLTNQSVPANYVDFQQEVRILLDSENFQKTKNRKNVQNRVRKLLDKHELSADHFLNEDSGLYELKKTISKENVVFEAKPPSVNEEASSKVAEVVNAARASGNFFDTFLVKTDFLFCPVEKLRALIYLTQELLDKNHKHSPFATETNLVKVVDVVCRILLLSEQEGFSSLKKKGLNAFTVILQTLKRLVQNWKGCVFFDRDVSTLQNRVFDALGRSIETALEKSHELVLGQWDGSTESENYYGEFVTLFLDFLHVKFQLQQKDKAVAFVSLSAFYESVFVSEKRNIPLVDRLLAELLLIDVALDLDIAAKQLAKDFFVRSSLKFLGNSGSAHTQILFNRVLAKLALFSFEEADFSACYKFSAELLFFRVSSVLALDTDAVHAIKQEAHSCILFKESVCTKKLAESHYLSALLVNMRNCWQSPKIRSDSRIFKKAFERYKVVCSGRYLPSTPLERICEVLELVAAGDSKLALEKTKQLEFLNRNKEELVAQFLTVFEEEMALLFLETMSRLSEKVPLAFVTKKFSVDLARLELLVKERFLEHKTENGILINKPTVT